MFYLRGENATHTDDGETALGLFVDEADHFGGALTNGCTTNAASFCGDGVACFFEDLRF